MNPLVRRLRARRIYVLVAQNSLTNQGLQVYVPFHAPAGYRRISPVSIIRINTVLPKEMHYWRKDSFEKLATIQDRLAEHPELAHYVGYLNNIELGLRRQALAHIEPLIGILQQLDIPRQRELASILCRETEISTGHRLIPHPLQAKFIQPVIRDWLESDSDAAEPRRWTGDLEDLKRAVELDSSCDHTRWRLIMRILEHVGFSTHELPA